MGFIRGYLELIGRNKRLFGFVVFSYFCYELVRIGRDWYIGRLFESVSDMSGFVDSLTLALLFAAFWIVGIGFNSFADISIVKLLYGIEKIVSEKSLKHLMSLSVENFGAQGSGRLSKRIDKGIGGSTNIAEALSWDLTSAFIQYAMTTIFLTHMFWIWGVSLTVLALVFLFLTHRLNKIKAPLRELRHQLYEDIGQLWIDVFTMIPTIQVYGKERTELESGRGIFDKIYETGVKEYGSVGVRFNAMRSLLIVVSVLIILVGASAVIYGMVPGDLSSGDMVTAYNLSIAAGISLYKLSRILIRFMDHQEAVSRLLSFMKLTPKVVEAKHPKKLDTLRKGIVFENVSYSYPVLDENGVDCKLQPDVETQGVYDINLEISAGEMVAFVGSSGSGKTTLSRLLFRMFDPDNGRILMDGLDLKELSKESRNKLFAAVYQDSLLFDRTIEDNVGYGSASKEETWLWSSLSKAQADKFVREFPEQLGTLVGERGIMLSGGQRQRVALAQALAVEPSILVLDEATSSLDPISELGIQAALKNLRATSSTTIVVIAHRLSTIRDADKIVVLDKGRIVEVGSHQELVARDGAYSALVEAQAVA